MKGDFLAYFKKLADKKNSKWVIFFFIDFFHSASSTTPGAPDKPCGVGRADANPKLLLNDT